MTVLIAGSAGLGACASNGPATTDIKVAQALTVVEAGGKQSSVEAGGRLQLADAPVLVRADRRLPVYVIPLPRGEREVTLDLPMIDDSIVGVADPKAISSLLFGVQNIQKLVNEGRLEQALREVQERRRDFPEVGYLMALEGSVRLLLRQNSAAATLYEAALQKNPENAEIQDALRRLRGEKTR